MDVGSNYPTKVKIGVDECLYDTEDIVGSEEGDREDKLQNIIHT